MGKDYFHGTWSGYIYSIMTRGFELGHEGRGNLLGRGVYIAQRVSSAALWTFGAIIIRCRLQPGTRILWVDDEYDRRVIDSLRREFGQELLDLGPHFHKAIPHNKQLTRQELIHLCSYIMMTARRKRWQTILRARKGKRVQYFDAWRRLSRLHEQAKRHGYDAFGDRSFSDWDSDEILVYNPARVIPVSAHRIFRDEADAFEIVSISEPIELQKLKAISEKAQEEEE